MSLGFNYDINIIIIKAKWVRVKSVQILRSSRNRRNKSKLPEQNKELKKLNRALGLWKQDKK